MTTKKKAKERAAATPLGEGGGLRGVRWPTPPQVASGMFEGIFIFKQNLTSKNRIFHPI